MLMRYEEFKKQGMLQQLKANKLDKVELNDFEPEEVLEVVNAIPKECGLLSLVLRGGTSYLKTPGAKAVAAALEKCASLQILDLSCNNISTNGAMALAPAIEKCTSMQNLNLGANLIGDKGAIALAPVIAKCTSLHSLNLSDNNIRDGGAKALVSAIEKCTSLLSLDLSSNYITDEGATALANATKYNLNIREFDLDLTGTNPTTRIRLKEEVDQKPARQAVMTLMRDLLQARDSGQSPITQNHITRFVNADGDHAIMTKVLRLLI